MALNTTDQAILLIAVFLTAAIFVKNSKRLPYPPGPKKLLLVGNLFNLPKGYEWETYARWSKDYNSDVLHVRVTGTDIIILNSLTAAHDLLDKRSSIYSSRPQRTMINDLMGYDWLFSSMPYGDRWRERRRLFQNYFHPNNTEVQPTQIKFVRDMLPRLLEKPEDFLSIIKHTIGGVALAIAYGLDIQKENDPYLSLNEKAASTISEAAVPGAFLVDMFTPLKYVPEWIPGAGFQKKAKQWRKIQQDVRERPFAEVIKNMASGLIKPSLALACLEEIDPRGDVSHQTETIKDTSAIVFGGASHTTTSGITTFFAAMMCYPEVQRKAQEELDHVLGGRLPEFQDRPNLPYLEALMKEIIRWKPATPIAIPHLLTQDDVYDGYRIPKGAIVVGNAWAMLHNEERYPDPSAFNPDRYLRNGKWDPDVPDPTEIAFGFGRRVCPGKHVALSISWLTFATILSTFDISRPLDKDGKVLTIPVQYFSGLIHHPLPFQCKITVRSPEVERLIRSSVLDGH